MIGTANRNSRRACERALANADTYDEWRDAASELDRIEGKDEWREDPYSDDYNYKLIGERLAELRLLRQKQDVRQLAFALHEGLHGNLGNMANPKLYEHCRYGTKKLVTDYVNEVTSALNWLCDNEFDDFPFGEKMRFFKRTGMAFGRSGLLLSGGATLGIFHIGVVKAIWEEGLLPRVMSGSSAGSIIGGAVATHSDDELESMFDPEYLKLNAWKTLSIMRAFREKAVMDNTQLEKVLTANIGDYSFEEAFQKTGRIMSVTVSPADPHQQGRILNFMTSPSVMISRASLASCAVPAIFPPVSLTAKDVDGNVVPYMPTMKWVDGSVHSDLPMLRMARLHNVNHYIVSQTNPHVLPFVSERSARRSRSPRKGLMPFASGALRSTYSVYGKHLLKLARDNIESQQMRLLLEKAVSITDQKYYSGDINIFAQYTPRKYFKMLSNPQPEDIIQFAELGQRATWPKIERIRNQTKISRTFEDCIQRLKQRSKVLPVEKQVA